MGQGGFGRFVAVGVLLAAILGGVSCGTSNDQGISFRSIGFFQPDDSGEIDEEDPQGDLGQAQALGCTAGFISSFIGLENNMVQGINVQRVDLGYRIPGGSLNLERASEPFSQRLGPSSGQETSEPRAFGEIFLLSPQQLEFLNQNRNRLPEPPFRLIVTAEAVGTADSGDTFRTNEVTYPIDLLDDDDCLLPGEQPTPDLDPPSDPEPTVAPFQTPTPLTQPTPLFQ